MTHLPHLFANNRAWAQRVNEHDPGFFEGLAAQQSPSYLWIGCADSRVPANEIVGLRPGELFVHRNVANVVVHTDLNCLSVIQYAVDVLQVSHIIVCGHYDCSGVRAAYLRSTLGLIDNWLRHVQDVRDRYRQVFAAIDDDDAAIRRLCELNVIEQVRNVAETTILHDAWRRGQEVLCMDGSTTCATAYCTISNARLRAGPTSTMFVLARLHRGPERAARRRHAAAGVARPFQGRDLLSVTTVSMCSVCGNMSTACTRSTP